MIDLMARTVFRLLDFIIIAAAVAVVILLSVYIYSSDSGEAVVKITAADTEYIYPLSQNTEVFIDGPIGQTLVIISDSKAWISESPCENKLCILMGQISKPGQWAACMPNRVFISIEGGSDDQEIDVLSY